LTGTTIWWTASAPSVCVVTSGSFVVVVNEVNSGTVGAAYTLTVDGLCLPCTTYSTSACCPTITVAPASLPVGSAAVAYTPTVVTPSGGTAPYSFTVTGLPTGMTSTPSGTSVTIGGTPAAAFSGTVTVSGTDAHGCPFRKDYVLTVTGLGPASLAVDVSGFLSANVPPNPQHTSASGSSTSVMPRTLRSSRNGLSSTRNMRSEWHVGW